MHKVVNSGFCQPGERYKSELAKGNIHKFLAKYGFEVEDEFDAEKLKEKSFYS